jgi:hypothetical protein
VTRRTAYWLCQLGGWGVYVVFTTLQELQAGELGIAALGETVFAGILGAALTHGLRAVIRRRRWLRRTQRGLAWRMALAALAIAMLEVAALATIEARIYGPPRPVALIYAVVRWTMAFLVWGGAYVSLSLLDQQQRDALSHAQLEAAVHAAELRALEARLNPHFLFNALNSVRALVGDDPERARDAITKLARMLRYVLAIERDGVVGLDRELEIMNDYLGIERLRLDTRLQVVAAVDAAKGARLPPLILQTLVENAIKHGIARLPEGGTVHVSAQLRDGALAIEVVNPRSAAAATTESTGIGLANARERLRLVYGDRATLELDLSIPDRATARLVVPQGVHA